MPTKAEDRVKVWNTFFELTREQAIEAKRAKQPKLEVPPHRFLGGTLNTEQKSSLALTAFSILALEARANHLLEELSEKGLLSKKELVAAKFLNADQKWALLPKLARRRSTIKFDKPPHQCVTMLCQLRNDLFHVSYERLVEKLPASDEAVRLFNQFVDAMEDMNVLLGRIRKARRYVAAIKIN